MSRRYSIRLTDQGFRVSCSELGIETCGPTIDGAVAELKRKLAVIDAKNLTPPPAERQLG